ncbi:Dihydropteroate synthase [Planctomycetes bacterium Poly30]|uniref:Dihydropteroate synthase n=1 Tax=Saltatorellus ferox TaxID=2528018 RepID=A0A518EQD9_9BACT|nr:Dihydropteroate synthase [Planctomycetes bacterium Poly30]
MGILNVTPDSFSDGGKYLEPAAAVARAKALIAEGADVLDIGGESTRPGADPVAEDEELRRVVPVIRAIANETRAVISIDTMKAGVAEAAVEAGARIVNDVSAGLADPRMLQAVADLRRGPRARDVHIVLMHRQGDPRTMQVDPRYSDPVAEVAGHLKARADAALAVGIPANRIALDPGIGFGKRLPHNLALLGRLGELRELGYPILLGASRKSFIGHITGAEDPGDWLAAERLDTPSDRIGGTAAAIVLGVQQGVEILRIHDVSVMREAVLVARAIARGCS